MRFVEPAGALPMPVLPEPRTLDVVEHELTGARLSLYEEELETARLRLALKSAQRGRRELRGDCEFAEGSRQRWRAACISAERERDELRARVAELEAERRKYVGVEPTIAEEMAYLSRCLNAVHDLCDEAAAKGITSGGPFTVEAVRIAADGDRPSVSRPALPWAHAMSDHDLHGFLDDLVSAAMGRWRSEPEVPDRTVLADIEKVCADWRTPGAGSRLDGSEFDGAVVRLAEPEGEFHGSLHHSYRLGHDMPETGGTPC